MVLVLNYLFNTPENRISVLSVFQSLVYLILIIILEGNTIIISVLEKRKIRNRSLSYLPEVTQ